MSNKDFTINNYNNTYANEYEYTRSIKAGFTEVDSRYNFIFPNADNTDDLKDTLNKFKQNIESALNIITNLKKDLELIIEQSDKKTLNKNNGEVKENGTHIPKIEIKTSFVDRFVEDFVKNKHNRKLAKYYSSNELNGIIKLLNQFLGKVEQSLPKQINIKDIKIRIECELEKPEPKLSNIRQIARDFRSFPAITYKDNRTINLLDFLFILNKNIKHLSNESEWSNIKQIHSLLDEYSNSLREVGANTSEVVKASFNKATVNKSYIPEEAKEKRNEIALKLSTPLGIFIQKYKSTLNKNDIKNIQDVIDRLTAGNPEEYFEIEKLELKEAAIKLKKFYNKFIKKPLDKELKKIYKKNTLTVEAVKNLVLFNEIININCNKKDFLSNFIKYKNELFQLIENSEKNNQYTNNEQINEQIQEKAKIAGEAYTNLLKRCPSNFIKSKNKLLAHEYGKLKQQLNSIDQSRFFLSHCALLVFGKRNEFKSSSFNILFIPKSNIKDFTKLVRHYKNADGNNHIIYQLHSLTLQALKNKLIPKNAPGLLPYLKSDDEKRLICILKTFLEAFFFGTLDYLQNENINIDSKFKEDIHYVLVKLINKKYREILPREMHKRLKNILMTEHNNLDEFRYDLEKHFYYLQRYNVDLYDFLSKLNRKIKKERKWVNRSYIPFIGKVEYKNIKNRYYNHILDELLNDIKYGKYNKTRINPEVTLFATRKNEKLGNVHKKSRHNQDRYTIQFSYTKNKPSHIFDTKFKESDEWERELTKFNKQIQGKIFNIKSNNGKYLRIGVDIGTDVLASIAIFSDWNKARNIQEEGFPFSQIPFYSIKDLKSYAYIKSRNKDTKEIYPKKVYIYKNPSLFLHSDESKRAFEDKKFVNKVNPNTYLEAQNGYALNICAAKVVNGKIVLNADLVTYLKWFIIKRIIFSKECKKSTQTIPYCIDKLLEKIINKKVNIDENKNKDKITITINSSETIKAPITLPENLDEELLKNILSEAALKIQTDLSKLDDELKTEFIEQLGNKLTKNITANIVGVLYYIVKNYADIVEIFIESEPEMFIQDHEKWGTSITREFPSALLSKLQKLELTPPRVNRQFLEREYKIHEQRESVSMRFGVVKFITAGGTSVLCPVCMNKRKSKWAKCDNDKCNFDLKDPNQNYGIIDDDILAATNLTNPNITDALKKM